MHTDQPPGNHVSSRTTRSALLFALLGAIGAAWLLGACAEPEPKIGPRRAPSSAVTDAAKVKELCDFFAFRAVDTLGTEGAQGNVDLLARRPGVPDDLQKAAHGFYADGITRPDTPDHRTVLEMRYTTVMRACQGAGTGWVRP